ncbi:mediator of RNA polymerase II transcription subunit 13-like, partial [Parasteatoda tepidariorum]|uniref:mediator of RNA polymerase II transcription subunit 13-like n=1 Tax=Parasteatoda tepidariorum TaxID=114398 RepID=UPI001C729C64|nr:mediator of RNA polymerase II transcription subunit 13-like [Parasteatoda tepidariorum]
MFPTPPSNTAPSPSGVQCGTDLSTLDSTDCYRDRTENYLEGGCSPYYEPVKDWSFVYKLPVQYKFIGSKRYASLTTLPSQLQPLTLTSDHIYKPSWTHTVSSAPLPANTTLSNSQVSHPDRLATNSKF